MNSSTFNIFNRVVYIGFGLLLGIQAMQFWDRQADHTRLTNESSDALVASEDVSLAYADNPALEAELAHKQHAVISLGADDKQLIQQVVRDEIRMQLSNASGELDSRDSDVLLPASSDSSTPQHAQSNSTQSTDSSQLQTESYEVANQIIEDAISSNQWDSIAAKQLVDQFRFMTVKQELEVRTKFANAVNEGWITPNMPLDLVLQGE